MHENENKLDDDKYQVKLSQLEDSIKENKFQYQSYVDIIELSRNQSDMNKLKEYREKMCQLYPLTESKNKRKMST